MPLGAILQQAGLVSTSNVKEALQQQKSSKNLRIGEILALNGYIDAKTADFFVESLPLIKETPKKLIGQYFKEANLLTQEQIQTILQQQKTSQLKFGQQAVVNGFLAQTTVDFFLQCLKDDSATKSDRVATSELDPLDSMKQVHDSFYKIKLKLLNLEDREDYYETVLKKVLLWTEGQSCLTQKLFKLIADNQDIVIAGKEAEQVDHLVHTKVLSNWRKQAVSDHLLAIEDRLINNKTSQSIELLRLYQKILTTTVVANNDKQQQELIKTGLVVRQQDSLAVANRIYKYVFDFKWIEEKIIELSNKPKSTRAVAPAKSSTVVSVPKEKEKEKKLFSIKNLLLLLTLLTLMLVFFNNLSRKIRIRTAFKKGNEFLQQKSFERAIAEYNSLLDIDSNYFQAWTNRGYALAGLQKYDEMRESCSTATIINPRAVYAWNCQGEALHNLKREAEAVAVFDRAIALDRTDPIFSINKSESLKSLGEEEESLATISEAIKVLEQIEEIKGKEKVKGEFAVALTFLANGYRKQKKYEPAIFNYNRALEYSPNYFPAQLGKGIILNRVQRYQQAQEEFESILQNDGLSTLKQAQTWFYLGKNLCQSGQNDKSVIAFERAIELKPDYEAAKEAKNNCI